MIITYILKTESDEYFCSSSNNIEKQLDNHLAGVPKWFNCYKNRKQFKVIYLKNGDYTNKIRKFGIAEFIKCCDDRTDSLVIDILPLK